MSLLAKEHTSFAGESAVANAPIVEAPVAKKLEIRLRNIHS